MYTKPKTPIGLRLTLVMVISALFAMGPAFAATKTSEITAKAKAAELDQLRKRISALQNRIRRDKSLEDDISQKLRDTELRIGTVSQRLSRIKSQIHSQERRLGDLEDQRSRHGDQLKIQRELLASQVRAAYAMGRQEQIKLLLNQQDPAQVGRTLVYYGYLNRARAEQISAIDLILENLQAIELSIRNQTEELSRTRKAEEENRQKLVQSRGERKRLLVRLKKEMKNSKRQLDRYVSDEKALVRLLIQLQQALEDMPMEEGNRKVFAKQKGRLPWPTKGRLVVRYGSSRQVGNLRWQGVIIKAGEGQEVRSVSHGRVAFADWFRGFGLLIILDHGDGFMSLYGHNQSLLKETGDWVDPNEVIATIGDSGGQVQAGLYFEIRRNGKPVNPQSWCRKRSGSLVGMN